jgi:hypothetical protein
MSVSVLTLMLDVFDNRTFSLASGARAVLTVGDLVGLVGLLTFPPIGMKDLGGALATIGTIATGDAFGITRAGFDGAGTVLTIVL